MAATNSKISIRVPARVRDLLFDLSTMFMRMLSVPMNADLSPRRATGEEEWTSKFEVHYPGLHVRGTFKVWVSSFGEHGMVAGPVRVKGELASGLAADLIPVLGRAPTMTGKDELVLSPEEVGYLQMAASNRRNGLTTSPLYSAADAAAVAALEKCSVCGTV
jgi:hypothetical protein